MGDPDKPDGMLIYDFDPNNLPAEYLQAIGLVVAASSQTEAVLQDFIGALLGIDNIDAIALTAHMAAPLKDHVVRVLAELKSPYACDVDEIDDLMDAVNDALGTRNTIVHNAFAIHPKTGQILSYRIKARGTLQSDLTPVTVEEIRENARAIHEAGLNIVSFMLSRGLSPILRQAPLREPLDRRRKARTARRERHGERY
jgi:hypothetical protein